MSSNLGDPLVPRPLTTYPKPDCGVIQLSYYFVTEFISFVLEKYIRRDVGHRGKADHAISWRKMATVCAAREPLETWSAVAFT